MRKDVRDAENRIFRIVSDCNIDLCAVGLDHDSIDGKRACNPLILLDSTIIVRIQVYNSGFVELVFIDGILLGVESGRIDVSSQDVHTLADFITADVEQNQALAHLVVVDLVTGLELIYRIDIPVAVLLSDSD